MASPLGTLAGAFKFPGETVGKGDIFQTSTFGLGVGDVAKPQEQFGRFFEVINKLLNRSRPRREVQRFTRSAVSAADSAFNQAVQRTGSGLASRGLSSSGIADTTRGGLAQQQAAVRGSIATEAEDLALESGIRNASVALQFFNALAGLRFGQAQVDLGFDQLRSSTRSSRLQNILGGLTAFKLAGEGLQEFSKGIVAVAGIPSGIKGAGGGGGGGFGE